MRKTVIRSMTAVIAAMLTLSQSACAQSSWTKQSAPIMTVWGEQVTEENAWQEYPRPSTKRQEWMNLNGI